MLANSLAVVLFTCIIAGDCGCPISIRVVRSGTTYCAFINDAPISASDAYAMKFVMILNTLWMRTLSGGSSL